MNSKNKFFSAKGMSLVELSFLLPVVFLFIFAGVEFSRTLRVKILAQNLSRELANTLVRECVGYTTEVDTESCIDRFQSSISAVANGLVPGTVVYGSIFRADPTTGNPTVFCQNNAPTPANPFPSKVKIGLTGCGTLDPAATDLAASLGTTAVAGRAQAICAAEVYIPYVAILGFIPGYFQYNPTSFYAANTI